MYFIGHLYLQGQFLLPPLCSFLHSSPLQHGEERGRLEGCYRACFEPLSKPGREVQPNCLQSSVEYGVIWASLFSVLRLKW